MKAFITKDRLIIHERGRVLTSRQCESDSPRAVVDQANDLLRHFRVYGEDAQAWAIRESMARTVLDSVLPVQEPVAAP